MDRASFVLWVGAVHQNIPVIIFIPVIAEEIVICIPASQKITIIIHDHIFIMHPAHAFPRHQNIDPVIHFYFDVIHIC